MISSVLEQLSGKSLEGFLFLEMTPITIAAALKPHTLRAVQSDTEALIWVKLNNKKYRTPKINLSWT